MLMAAHYPDHSNRSSIVTIPGSGRHSLLALSARQQTAVDMFGLRLVDAGYAVFAANDRMAPLNKGPAALEGAGGTVRFVCHYARRSGSIPSGSGALVARPAGT